MSQFSWQLFTFLASALQNLIQFYHVMNECPDFQHMRKLQEMFLFRELIFRLIRKISILGAIIKFIVSMLQHKMLLFLELVSRFLALLLDDGMKCVYCGN